MPERLLRTVKIPDKYRFRICPRCGEPCVMNLRWAKNRGYSYYYAAHGRGVVKGAIKRTWCYLGKDPSVYVKNPSRTEGLSEVRTEMMRKQEDDRLESPHEAIESMLNDIGKIIGKTVQIELQEGLYRYDVIWKDSDSKDVSPSHVFEIQDKGNLDSAWVKLQLANDKWRARVFLVVLGEKNRSRLNKMLEIGTHHMLSRRVVVLAPDEVREIHKCFASHKETIKAFVEPF